MLPLFFVILTPFLLASHASAQSSCSAISVGNIAIDSPTFSSLGFSLPITNGDTDLDATVTVKYKKSGTTQWKDALPLLRVIPAGSNVPEQFAGSIFHLFSATNYDVEFHLVDPDGCDEAPPGGL